MIFLLFSCKQKVEKVKSFEEKLAEFKVRNIIAFSQFFGNIKGTGKYFFEIEVDKTKLQKNLKNKNANIEGFIFKAYKNFCISTGGRLDINDKEINKMYSDMVLGGIRNPQFPEVYLEEYSKQNYNINFSHIKNVLNIQKDFLNFCYYPDKKKFWATVYKEGKKNIILKIYKGSVIELLNPIAEKVIKRLKKKIQKIIEEDLANIVWISLNIPLSYEGVKLYYFKAEPVYETEEDKRKNLGTDLWNVYIKLKNTTLKPSILDISKITLVKDGKEYKPLLKIDAKGNILGVDIKGNCKRLDDNKVLIEGNGKCFVYFIYDPIKHIGGLKFPKVKSLRGAILLFFKYPIYIWNISKYDMKIEGLKFGEDEKRK